MFLLARLCRRIYPALVTPEERIEVEMAVEEQTGKAYPYPTYADGIRAMTERIVYLERIKAAVDKQTDRADQVDSLIAIDRDLFSARDRLRNLQSLLGERN